MIPSNLASGSQRGVLPLILLPLGLILFLFREPILSGWVTAVAGDVLDQFLPWRVFTADRIAQGEIPLWNRFSFCGAPFLANMQSAVLYPVDRFLDLWLSPERGLMAGVVLHLMVAFLALYALARRYGAEPIGASAGAIGFALSGFNAIHFWGGNLLTVQSSVFLPLHFLLVRTLADRISSGSSVSWVPLAAAVVACFQVLSGHAQMTFYNALFVALFTLPILCELGWKKAGKLVGWLAAIGCVAGLLAAPQILPTLEYSGYASRSGTLPFLPATEFSFGWEFLPSLFLPEYLGTRADMRTPLGADTYWGDWKNWSAVYLGILPALGAVFLLAAPLARRANGGLLKAFGFLLVVALVLALGRNTPVYRIVHEFFPLFGKFRAPSKFLPGFLVPLSVLGAVGISAWLSQRSESPPETRSRVSSGVWAALVAAGFLGLAVYVLVPSFRFPSGRAGLFLRDLARSFSLAAVALGGVGWIGASQKAGETENSAVKRRGWVRLLILAVVLFDLGFYFQKYLLFAPIEKLQRFPVELVNRHLKPGERILATSEIPQTAFCIPAGIPNVGGYDPFQVGDFVDHFRREGALPDDQIPDAWSPPPRYARELGVGLVLSSHQLRHPGLVPADRFLYRVQDPAPLVEYQPAEGSSIGAASAALEWKWDGDRLCIEGKVPSPGRIVIRQTYVPGWVARSEEGELLRVEKSAPFWQSVEVSPGPMRLVFSYEPRGWKMGKRLFPCGLLGCLALGVPIIRSRKP